MSARLSCVPIQRLSVLSAALFAAGLSFDGAGPIVSAHAERAIDALFFRVVEITVSRTIFPAREAIPFVDCALQSSFFGREPSLADTDMIVRIFTFDTAQFAVHHGFLESYCITWHKQNRQQTHQPSDEAIHTYSFDHVVPIYALLEPGTPRLPNITTFSVR